MKKLTAYVICFSFLAGFWLIGEEKKSDPQEEIMALFFSISSNELFDYARILSSPAFNGRRSGGPGYMKSARWVADHLKEWGIKPGGDNGSYFQYFDNPYTEVKDVGSLTIRIPVKGGKTEEIACTSPKDYFAGSNSSSGKVSGKLVYAGFGITAPELGYDDYKRINVKGKIVVIDGGIPYSRWDKPRARWRSYSSSIHKLKNAKKHGAVGMLYIGKTANPNTPYQKNFIYCHIDKHVVSDLFKGTKKDHGQLKKMIVEKMKPRSFYLKKEATITASTVHFPDARSCNVIGILPGSDPVLKDEVIIMGAHLDGVGNLGFLLPGALDNASGVVDIMGAAGGLSRFPRKLKRSVMFLFFGGEECGLFGSRYYTANPVFPKEKTACFINLDMVGNGTGLYLWNGLSYPGIHRHFKEANDRFLHRKMSASEARVSYGRPRSDGRVMQNAGFTTLGIGSRGRVKKVYWHDPRDTVETLTPEIMEDVAKWLFLSVSSLADDDDLK